MKCGCCGEAIVYCGIPVAHYGRVVPLRNATEPFDSHSCDRFQGGGFALVREQFIVPLFDGATILCIEVNRN